MCGTTIYIYTAKYTFLKVLQKFAKCWESTALIHWHGENYENFGDEPQYALRRSAQQLNKIVKVKGLSVYLLN